MDGVLLMELVADAEGGAAPRLGDLSHTAEQALEYHDRIIGEIVRMLCAGLVHGDLSPFNVLVDSQGPVIIDLPQAVDAAGNNSAAMMLDRDVANMRNWFGQFAPELLQTDYASEIWALYQEGALSPETELSGIVVEDDTITDIRELLLVIDDARQEAAEREAREEDADL